MTDLLLYAYKELLSFVEANVSTTLEALCSLIFKAFCHKSTCHQLITIVLHYRHKHTHALTQARRRRHGISSKWPHTLSAVLNLGLAQQGMQQPLLQRKEQIKRTPRTLSMTFSFTKKSHVQLDVPHNEST